MVRHYVESGIFYRKAGLDQKTMGLLYFAMGSMENVNKDYSSARQYLAESYNILAATQEKHIILDVLDRLGIVCYNLSRYDEMNHYHELAMQLLEQERMDTRRIRYETGIYVDKAKTARMQERYKEAIQWLEKAEKLLSDYEVGEMAENDGIVRIHLVIYGVYFDIYGDRGRGDIQTKYVELMLEYAKKAYQLNPGDRNYRNLAISYRNAAKNTQDEKLRVQYFDKTIQIMKELFEESPTSIRWYEFFDNNRTAIDYTYGEIAQKYITACEEMLQNSKPYPIRWKEAYIYQRSLLLHYREENDWDKADAKLQEVEQMLEAQKEKLSERKYQDYLIWNYRHRGISFQHHGRMADAARMWEKEMALEKKEYMKDAVDLDILQYATVCKRLAKVYRELGLTNKVLYYSLEKLAVYKKVLEDIYSYSTVFAMVDTIRDLKDIYRKQKQYDEVISICEEAMQYLQSLYEETKDGEWLDCMLDVSDGMVEVWLEQGKVESALANQEMLLALHEQGDFVLEDEETKNRMMKLIDFMKCRVSRIYLIKKIELEKARKYLLEANCPYSEFNERDRELYLGKVESSILQKTVKPLYLTREQGIEFLKSV